MKFSVSTLLATLADDKYVAAKVLEKKLGCEDTSSLRQLQIALDALEKAGIVEKDRSKYRRVQETGYVEGRLRCSSKGFCFAIQDDDEAEDIYIRESKLNHAWNGDRVLVSVTKEASRRRSPEGQVRLILERANTSVLARIKTEAIETAEGEAESQYRAVPLDDRLLFELDLSPETEDLSQADEHLVNVEVLRYPLGRHAPLGRITQVLGSDAEAASDIDIVCCKHSLPSGFSEAVQAAEKALPTRVRKADQKGRIDLRELDTVAIYGELPGAEAQMVDNAISLEQTEEGWRISFHTADVATYVPLDSPIDQAAKHRGTAVYLGQTVLPMLPEQLAFNLCSFQSSKDRLAMSVLVDVNPQGEVLRYEIQPSLVSVNAAVSYEQAQAILDRDDKTKNIKKYAPVYELIEQVSQVGQLLKAQRRSQGSFELNLPERLPVQGGDRAALFSRTAFNDEGQGTLVSPGELSLRGDVAEFQLMANQLVAEHLQVLKVPMLFRTHRPPELLATQELIKLIGHLDIELELLDEEKVSPLDYQNFLAAFSESEAERVLIYQLQQTLKPASYSLSPGPHFGLALEHGYTHFACPARRYCDLQIQRVLHGVFDKGRDRRTTRSKERVDLHSSEFHEYIAWNILPPELHQELELQFQTTVVQLGERENRAQEAEADLIGLKKAELMKARTGEVFPGLITRVQNYGFFVEIDDWLVEGLVHVSSLKDDWYEHRIRQQRLVGRKNRQQYSLGDRVEVQVKSVDYYRQQIDLIVVGGGSEGQDDGDDGEQLEVDFDFEARDSEE
ncbi:MAG: VacB/RNase II family 3'-5' exoribonuclease [Synechococcales cyanobacterium RM1_1_8]|nr:VacB/RNase II family 3'-5' exoribonuclease [Synechococcales cyanobacterium RM1_1_8]